MKEKKQKQLYTKQSLYQLEKELIKKHKKILGKVKPRLIKFVKNSDYCAMASDDFLEVDKKSIYKKSMREVENLIAHELNHYALPNEGHSDRFIKNLRKIGYKNTNYELRQNLEEGEYSCTKEILPPDESGVCRVRSYKRPQWHLFKENIDRGMHGGQYLKSLRLKANLTISQLSKEIKISAKEIKRLESIPDPFVLDTFAEENEMKKIFNYLAKTLYL